MEQMALAERLAELPLGEARDKQLVVLAAKAREEALRLDPFDEMANHRLRTRAYAIETFLQAGALLAACNVYADAPQYERQELKQRIAEPLIQNATL